MDHSVYYEKDLNMVICHMGNNGKYKLVAERANDLNINIYNKDNQLLLSDNLNEKGSVNAITKSLLSGIIFFLSNISPSLIRVGIFLARQ